ncbi:MAG TPA: 1-(5-phosphoribosyl)-5-[(5-phosphoribosylamino)methylideneamino]imidazole-4-carboxamide isomerase [Dehalococcoidia bacterium]|nr:1-(5-phosphoribosyl)-5-[(5-phosphoribosylamino)methylideneamino]imidazole-4-carboxamide isomerase [Dehalococcoidia bacterium]
MELIPAIDIRGGRCVRLEQGDYARETVFGDDPAAVAARWQETGALRLHVVDLDGAREGRPVNQDAVRRILDALVIPVQLGGGIRDIAAIQRYLEAGVDRVVLGTAAVSDQTTLLNALALFPGRVVVAVDARDGVAVTQGWLDSSGVPAADLVRQLGEMSVTRIIYTDTLRDGTLSGPNFAAVESLLSNLQSLPAGQAGRTSVIYSGGISSLDHLRRLAALDLEGVIVGKALYTGAIDLREALAALAP